MINIECDTELLTDTIDKISDNITEYELLINLFFKKINDVPSTGEWIGNNANRYCKLAVLDKEIYMKYADGIKELVNDMRDFAQDLDTTVRTNESNCENDKDRGYY